MGIERKALPLRQAKQKKETMYLTTDPSGLILNALECGLSIESHQNVDAAIELLKSLPLNGSIDLLWSNGLTQQITRTNELVFGSEWNTAKN